MHLLRTQDKSHGRPRSGGRPVPLSFAQESERGRTVPAGFAGVAFSGRTRSSKPNTVSLDNAQEKRVVHSVSAAS